MTLAIIELNDSEIRASGDGKILTRDPGYAVLMADRIATGIDAWKIARSNPRETTNRYWSQLNQDSLIIPSRLARHNADLAFSQLVAIHKDAGRPDEVLFAVPGSYNREQLSLLLGIVEACPFTAIGLVDSAVASISAVASQGTCHHIDIHLHYAVITTLDVTEHVTRKVVKVIDDVGISEIYDTCASILSDLFIDQSRFDPLHHAETEQSLYNQIPALLHDLKLTDEASLEIAFRDKRYHARIPAERILEGLKKHYDRIYRELSGTDYCLISDRLDGLPGFSRQLKNGFTIGENSVFEGCQKNLEHIRSDGPALDFITSLPATVDANPGHTVDIIIDEAEPATGQGNTPTHVLVNNRAWPLEKTIYISANGEAGAVRKGNTQCSIQTRHNDLALITEGDLAVYLNGNRVNDTAIVSSGDTITIAGSETTIKCIEVLAG